MKKFALIAVSLMLLLTACNSQAESSTAEPITAVQSTEPVTLTNRMTDSERARVSIHALTLLDEQDSDETPESSPQEPETAHRVSVEFMTLTPEMIKQQLAELQKTLSDEEYREAEKEAKPIIESAEPYRFAAYILVDGKRCTDYVPYSDETYDGGAFTFSTTVYDPETDETKREEYAFESIDKYTEWIRQYNIGQGYSAEWADRAAERMLIACEALKTGNYETLPDGTVDSSDRSLYDIDMPEEKTDYRDVWEYDRAEVEAISAFVDEISIWDEELDTEFLVHVTRPPDYNPAKTYPVFLLTDGVWRFGNVPDLRKCMENGEAAPVILVTLGFAYELDGTDAVFRYQMLVRSRYQLLNFITDNLMPYLGEQYQIDFAQSALYGHSDGGVFTHTALCKSDQYENQPFGKYLIGSPAFFGLYYDHPELDPAAYETDYGYFDRNQTLAKQVFLCGGKLEDPDYAESYNGHPSTLEGLAALNDRLTAHGTDVTCKLYDSHHYQYIPEMLTEYLKTYFPPKS